VHLRLMRDRLILVPPAALRVRREEADVLAEALNRHFAGRLELQVIDAERWVARLAGDFSFGAEPPLELAGRDVDLAAGRGSADRDARRHQLLNESQMVLHEHALNEAREARGEPAINSLWFWGAGRAPQTATNRWQSVSALEPVALGLSRAAKIRARSLPASAQEWLERAPEDGRHLVVLDALRAPLALAEPGEYGDALAALEGAWFAPLLGALRAGRIGMLTVHVPDGPECASFETIRADLRRFWRRPKALERYT
jgi:hypothetical protein